jgi:hypothetical protein
MGFAVAQPILRAVLGVEAKRVRMVVSRRSVRPGRLPGPRRDEASERRVGKSAQRCAHVSVDEDCKSAVGTLRFAHPTLATFVVFSSRKLWRPEQKRQQT